MQKIRDLLDKKTTEAYGRSISNMNIRVRNEFFSALRKEIEKLVPKKRKLYEYQPDGRDVYRTDLVNREITGRNKLIDGMKANIERMFETNSR